MSEPAARPRRPWLAWTVVGAAAIAIAASFLIGGDDAAGDQPSKKRPTPVSAELVKREAFTLRGEYPGELDSDSADVAAYFAGRLTAVHVRVGDSVEAGAVVAELDPVDVQQQIAQARAQVKAAAAEEQRIAVEIAAARVDLERMKSVPEVVSSQELDAARAKVDSLVATAAAADARRAQAEALAGVLGKRVVESKVKAPFAGRVAERYVDPGAVVAAGAKLVRLVKTAPLHVRFEVPEQDLATIQVGAAVTVTTQIPTDQPVTAKVSGVASEVSRERRVAIVEALIEAPPPAWLSGMYATAIAERRRLAEAITVPSIAVLSRMSTEGQVDTGVLVADGAAARWVPVRVLGRDGDRSAIDGELGADARVLVAGHVDLANGAPIQIVDPAAAAAAREER
jgi:RND family efflux transporter MFP subunit